jgi:hypothetical protein
MGLIAFFYRNDVPCSVAVQLFHACNDKTNGLVTEQFYYFYAVWRRSEDAVHLGLYYNTRIQKYVYINGSRKNQLEIIDPLDSDIPRGFGNISTQAIRNEIEHIRT